MAAWDQLVGQPAAIVMWYPSSAIFDAATLNRVVASGATPMLSWQPWNWDNGQGGTWTLAQVASGAVDTAIRQWAAAAAAWGRPLFLRPLYEANGNWSPRGLQGTTQAPAFIAAWRHMVGLVRKAGAWNVLFVWAPNVPFGGSTPYSDFYPGNAYVDWVGLDGYNFGAIAGHTWQSPTAVFDAGYAQITHLTSKPLMISEVASSEVGGDKAAWITDFGNAVLTRYPRVRAVVWFNDVKEVDWRVNSSASALAAFRAVAATWSTPTSPRFGR